MKDISDVVACVVDYGKFFFLADCIAKKAAKTYYHSPCQKEFQDIRDCVKGDGVDGVERIDSFIDQDIIKEVDLFVFPDIGFDGEQKYLRSIGKSVWGAMGANELELSRTKFLDMLDKVGLPRISSVKIKGLTNLSEHLKNVQCKWIKVNRFRHQMETRYHLDYEHSCQWLDHMAVSLGGMKDSVVFVVQDEIDCDVEIGYDGWSVDGSYPVRSFQGYELKNELYLGSLKDYTELPEEIRTVNESISPILKEFGYRNFMATEIRVKDGVPNFIDPTFRMAGLTEDQLPETCSNLPEVIWLGANGQLIEPEFICEVVAVATMHCKTHIKDEWFQLRIPDEQKRWFKLYHYCQGDDGAYHFIPSVPYECDEAGVVIGMGDTVEEAIENLKEHFSDVEHEPLSIDVDGFAELIKQVNDAEEQGMEFSEEKIPDPSVVLES